MKTRGFTLIELLAVIVILAIIGVIAIPIILNVVEKSKVSSAVDSAYGYIDAVEKYVVFSELDSLKYPYHIKNGTYSVTETKNGVPGINSFIDVKGDKPTSGEVILDEKGKIKKAELVINGYTIRCENGVCKRVANLRIKNKNTKNLIVDGELQLEAEKDGIDDITWKSSDSTVATVSKNGLVKGIKAGKVTITLSGEGNTDTLELTIKTGGILEAMTKEYENDKVVDLITVKGITYKAHVYNYEGNQTFTKDMVFGDASDVGTSSSYAKNMVVVKVEGDLTINEGVTVRPYYNNYGGPKGFLIYVTGKLINNGTIDNSHGAYAVGENVYLWENADGTYEYVPAVGAAGAAKIGGKQQGRNGTNGSGRQTGGGASGSGWDSEGSAGTTGTSYSGGTGGSGGGTVGATGNAGNINGGPGGNAYNNGEAGGGAGNPGGTPDGGNGTGGLLIIYSNEYQNNGSIIANGTSGGSRGRGSGGASGGGSINIFTNQSTGINSLGIVTNTRYNELLGSISISGGQRVGETYKSGAGGTGTINIGEIRDGQYYDLKEVIEQDKEEYISKHTKEGDSILSILNDNNLTSGYYIFKANNETYPVHLYVLEGNQIFSEDKIFGDSNDISRDIAATSTTSAYRSYAKNMVIVKVKGDLTINSGVTVRPYYTNYGGPKGFTLYVTGKLTNNGTIDNSHGAYAVGQDVYLWKNNDNSYEYIPAVGAAGAAKIGGKQQGRNGTNGSGRQTGGGASGSGWDSEGSAGTTGTSYSGGTGGSGGGTVGATGNAGNINGGPGGNAYNNGEAGGGAGNPGGTPDGGNGTGGLLIIYSNEYQNNGSIIANGTSGGSRGRGSGGASGGGSINIFYLNKTNDGNISASGGQRVGETYKSGAGGNGTVTYTQITN